MLKDPIFKVLNVFLHQNIWTNTIKYDNTPKINIIPCIKRALIQFTYKWNYIKNEVGLCNNKIASKPKDSTMITNFDYISRFQNLPLFKFNSQFHTAKISFFPSINQEPHHKENQQAQIV